MVREQIEARGIHDPELIAAMRKVPRHVFVESDEAYEDRALPLCSGQTISQPYIVAAMTRAARPQPRQRPRTQRTQETHETQETQRAGGWENANVLEIGTGSGYQAAILSELGANVTSIERHPALSEQAAQRLADAGYDNVRLLVGDGSQGNPEGAPWDVILVTAAGPSVPQPLLEQLHPDGGRLVMPVGGREHQVITVVERHGTELVSTELESVSFVPLIGQFGFDESA